MSLKRNPYDKMMDEDDIEDENLGSDGDDDESVSDFDEDEDPDKIEVPGGGRDLATAMNFRNNNKAGASGSSSTGSGTASIQNHPGGNATMTEEQKYRMTLNNIKNSYLAGKPLPLSSLGLPLLPVNTATTKIGGTTKRGGFNGSQASYSKYSLSAGTNLAASLLAQSKSIKPESKMGAGINMGAAPSDANANKLMMQNLQNLIAANPSFLTSGIPNKLLTQIFKAGPSAQVNTPANHLMHMAEPTKLKPQIDLTMINHEDEEPEEEEMGVAETYAEYWPAKVKLGKKHPDPVVETASLSSVEPTDVYYKLSLGSETINSGNLSALQLESITYAAQAHDHFLPDGSRAGFLIGDGAGVGKGRTIAGIIYENYLKGRKRAIWISVSNDLKYDAERDLRDIGAGRIDVYPLNKLKYAKISSVVKKGVIFSTYSALIGESQNQTGKYKSRLKQLLQWCGHEFDGCIIFDECHKAKNLFPVGSSKPTKTGLTALELQNKLPKARVVYASATGASEPRNMAYMVRLGMWGEGTAFPTFMDFITAVEKRGVGAMEIVAMDMKLRGMYIARQLSFHGVTFKIEEVPLTDEFRRVYDKSVELWVEAMQRFTEAAELIDAENRMKKTMWGQFWSAHQRFFKYLCIAAKVNQAVVIAREAIKYGKCVVIGLQSTGEARTLEQLDRDDGELTDFVSTAKGVFQSLVEKHFPAPDRSRINRLLSLQAQGGKGTSDRSGSSWTTANINNNNNANNKRKIQLDMKMSPPSSTMRKKKRKNSSDSDNSDHRSKSGSSSSSSSSSSDDDSDGGRNSDNGANTDSDGYQSSDFNPFDSGSDSDADPWVGRQNKKKKEKSKKPPKIKKEKSPPAATSANKQTSSSKATLERIQEIMASKLQQQKDQQNAQMAGASSTNGGQPPRDAIEKACSMKDDLLLKIERLGHRMPPNTLDQLIDELGGTENVAEMTGRKGRVVQNDDGSIQYESRSEQDVPLETLNLTEKKRFMDGEKDVAIISEAASSGISLQSDRRVRNQRRRVHITLELPWSADRAIQQFGRTHRSNQVSAPEYIFLISDLAGERRFASTVAKRLESLGALTHGDRRATETRDLSQFNIDNKYGRAALEAVMKTIMGYESPMVPPPQDYNGDFFKDVAGALVGVGLIVNSEYTPGVLSLDKDYNSMSKFLNRILGMPVDLQNRLFKYFTDTLAAIIAQAKKLGRFDMGILDLGAGGENVTRTKLTKFLRKHATGIAPTELHTVQVERGMIWQEAIDRWADLTNTKEGFYLSQQARNNKLTAILVCFVDASNAKKKLESGKSKKDIQVQIYRPNTGLQMRIETLAEIEKKYKMVYRDEAESHWQAQYDASVNTCSHAYWRGNCRNTALGMECEVGLRRRTYTVLSGSVLTVWSRVENILAMKMGGQQSKMQVIRLKTREGQKIVGTLIPKPCVEILIEELRRDAEKVEEQSFPRV